MTTADFHPADMHAVRPPADGGAKIITKHAGIAASGTATAPLTPVPGDPTAPAPPATAPAPAPAPPAGPRAWGTVTYPLIHPIPVDGGLKLMEIVFSEPNGEALEAIDELGMDEGKSPTIKQTLGLIRALSGQPKAITDKMHALDIKGASEAVGPLLQGAM